MALAQYEYEDGRPCLAHAMVANVQCRLVAMAAVAVVVVAMALVVAMEA
jgi:hypothetical protein